MAAIDEVGGPAFPFRIDPLTGGVQLAHGEEKIRQNVRLILGTRVGERPMLRDFGTRLPSLVHDPNDQVLADLIGTHAAEALLRFEPRIAITSSRLERDEDAGVLQLRLTYVHTTEQITGQAVLPVV